MAVTNLSISKLGNKGDGIHEGSEGLIFVPRTAPGDLIKARIYQDPEGVVRADFIELLSPSPQRQDPPCPHYDVCGNCTLQHLNEKYYQAWKVEMVKDAFRKVGVEPQQWHDPIFLGGENRRRATFSAMKFGLDILLGYYRRRSREISNIDSCLVADPKLIDLRNNLRPLLGPVLYEAKPCDFLVQLVGDTVDLAITGPLGKKGEPDDKVLAALEQILLVLQIERISWRASDQEDYEILFERDPVMASFGRLQVALPPAAFLQPTLAGEKALVNAVMNALPPKGKFADLFSGCGTFTGPLSERGSVEAFESVEKAVKALGKVAKVEKRDLFANPLKPQELNRYDAVVFDPPRAGCLELAKNMARAKTPVLVGVSCNPATFARDAKVLTEGGYRLESLQIIDQFLWSHHVEVVGQFRHS